MKKQLCKGIQFEIEMPRVNNQKTENLTDQELEKLLEALNQDTDTQVANMMKLALFTGMRRGALFKLNGKI